MDDRIWVIPNNLQYARYGIFTHSNNTLKIRIIIIIGRHEVRTAIPILVVLTYHADIHLAPRYIKHLSIAANRHVY